MLFYHMERGCREKDRPAPTYIGRLPAGVIVSPLGTENMPPCARWSLPLFISPACIFIANPRRHGRFAAGGVEYVSVCPLVAAVVHLAGVHFLFCFPGVMVVSTVPAGNMSPCARRPLPLLTSPACKNEAVGKSIALHRGRCDSF